MQPLKSASKNLLFMMRLMRLPLSIFSFLSFCFLFSCKPVKNINYAEAYLDSNKISLPLTQIPLPVIRPYDFLTITFYGKSPTVTALLNAYGGNPEAPGNPGENPNNTRGYQVSPDGYIDLPQFGRTKVDGLTVAQLKQQLTERASKLVLDPVVYVKFNSFKVTMLGEVSVKGVLTVPSEKITIMEAFGLSGDVTMYGVKTNVKVIREDSTGRTMGTVDLTNKNLFTSEYFYLKPNDVVYVPSDGQQKRQQNFNNIYPYVTLGLSAFSFLITVFYLFRN